jgi:hypothetical protein
MILIEKKFKGSLVGYFWLRLSHEVTDKCLLDYVDIENLSRLEDPLPRWLTHMTDNLVYTGGLSPFPQGC